jgi:hypothetical protein
MEAEDVIWCDGSTTGHFGVSRNTFNGAYRILWYDWSKCHTITFLHDEV